MTNKTLNLTPELYDYLLKVSLRDDPLRARIRAETAQLPLAQMLSSPEQGQLMGFLVRLIGAKKALEIGVFTGYSALCVAEALAEDGELIACDVNEEWTAKAKGYWQEAGLNHKIDLRLAPALETLDALLSEGQANSFDFAFLDADKANYPNYYERLMHLLRPGGLILVDNTLWSGRVIDPQVEDDDTQAIRAFNASLLDDQRVDLSLLPVSDGLTLLRKR